jgi:hypothetical protein
MAENFLPSLFIYKAVLQMLRPAVMEGVSAK